MVYHKRYTLGKFEATTADSTYCEDSTSATNASTTYNTIYDDDSASWVAVESYNSGTFYGVPIIVTDIIDHCEYNYDDEEDRVEKWLLKIKSMIQRVGHRLQRHNPMHSKKYNRAQKRRRR